MAGLATTSPAPIVSDRTLALALERLRHPVAIVGREAGEVRYCNDAFERQFGYRGAGQPLEDLLNGLKGKPWYGELASVSVDAQYSVIQVARGERDACAFRVVVCGLEADNLVVQVFDEGQGAVRESARSQWPTPQHATVELASVAMAQAPRVLIADDNRVHAVVMERLLTALGYEVETTENGQLAVASVATQNYQMIFMDCEMPVVDGFEATKRIRAQSESARGIPIVAVTSFDAIRDRQRCFDVGMNDLMIKPVRRAQLEDILARWCPLSATAT